MTVAGIIDQLVEIEALAARLRCSVKTVRRYEAEPDGLPFIKLGKRHLYRLEAVAAWLERREVQKNPRRRRRGDGRAVT